MHFGLPPRYSKDVKFIQVDIDSLAIGDNVTPAVGVAADVKVFVTQLANTLKLWQFSNPEWNTML